MEFADPSTTEVFVLDARDGRVLATYPISGSVALDAFHRWLYVDQGDKGLTVLDAETGGVRATVALPPPAETWQRSPAPLADPAGVAALAFRNNIVYVVDPQKGVVAREISFDVRKDGGSCSTGEGPLAIDRAVYDAERRILYVGFLTYVCTPWFGYKIVAYDMDSDQEIGLWGMLPFTASASDGRLYGSSWHRFGIGYRWVWLEGRPWFQSSDWGGGGLNGFQVDRKRGRLYEATEWDIRVFDAETMALLYAVPKPVKGFLSGFDPKTDNLYFLDEGRLRIAPLNVVRPPVPEPLTPATPPANPVRSLSVSTDWPVDKTLFGVWAREEFFPYACYVFGQPTDLPLISADGGATWSQPVGGLRGSCAMVTALAASPDYARDKTIFAGVTGLGLFKSSDSGRFWEPSSLGLTSMGIRQILLSPDYASDQTAFVQTSGEQPGALFKTTNGGRIWSQIETNLGPVALSPEYSLYGQDRTLMAVARIGEQSEVRVSSDGGNSWDALGEAPGGSSANLLSLAPLFAKWGVAFLHAGDGRLYRSDDGGRTWRAVLETAPSSSAQIAFAPGMEEGRTVFLLTTVPDNPGAPLSLKGTLYRSRDGGQNWEVVALPEGVQPTALAISPDFARDGLLFIGTGDGRVVQIQSEGS